MNARRVRRTRGQAEKPAEDPRPPKSEGQTRKVLFDLRNERIVLSTMIGDPRELRRLVHDLKPSDFGDPVCRVVMTALSQCAAQDLHPEPQTIIELAGGPQRLGDLKNFTKLVDEYDPARNVDFHVERLHLDAAKLRTVEEDLGELTALCADPKATGASVEAIAVRTADRFRHLGADTIVDPADLREERRRRGAVATAMQGLEDRTGYPIFDGLFGQGFRPGTISVVVGRPGHGKTTLVANLIRLRIAMQKRTFVCAWEADPDDFTDLIAAQMTGIPRRLIDGPPAQLDAAERADLDQAEAEIIESGLVAYQRDPNARIPAGLPPWEARELAQRNFAATVERAYLRGHRMIIVDVIGKMLPDRDPTAVTQTLELIRRLAKRHHVHIMLVHHLSRGGARGHPRLEWIKNSGAFEEEADLVIAVARHDRDNRSSQRHKLAGLMDVHILKQRKGAADVAVRYQIDDETSLLTEECLVDLDMMTGDDDAGTYGHGKS